MTQTENLKIYREFSAPFGNTEAASRMLEAFSCELEALRTKHKICDLVSVVQVNTMNSDGEEGVMTASISFGDPLKRPMILAQALGKEQRSIESEIGKLIKR